MGDGRISGNDEIEREQRTRRLGEIRELTGEVRDLAVREPCELPLRLADLKGEPAYAIAL